MKKYRPMIPFLIIFSTLSANAVTQKEIIQLEHEQYIIIKRENQQFIALLQSKDDQIEKYEELLQKEVNKPKKIKNKDKK